MLFWSICWSDGWLDGRMGNWMVDSVGFSLLLGVILGKAHGHLW